jgi:DNA-binding HxlR family transcriptional regulator
MHVVLLSPHLQFVDSLVALTLLTHARTRAILVLLRGGPLSPGAIEDALAMPHATVMDGLAELDAAGAITRTRASKLPPSVSCAITPAGDELLALADLVQGLCDDIAVRAGGGHPDPAAMARAVDGGWSSTVLPVLVAEPLSRSELSARITTHTHHQVEQRLLLMERAGLVRREPGRRPRRYALTEDVWRVLRVVVQSLGWGDRIRDATATPEQLATAVASVATDLVLGDRSTGVVACTIEGSATSKSAVAVTLTVEGGLVTASQAGPAATPTAWIRGDFAGWCDALLGGRADGIVAGGDTALSRRFVAGLRGRLEGRR